jgi:hypothetical protein
MLCAATDLLSAACFLRMKSLSFAAQSVCNNTAATELQQSCNRVADEEAVLCGAERLQCCGFRVFESVAALLQLRFGDFRVLGVCVFLLKKKEKSVRLMFL